MRSDIMDMHTHPVNFALAQLLLAQAQHIAPLADDDAEGILCHQEHLLFAFWKGDSGLELPFSIV